MSKSIAEMIDERVTSEIIGIICELNNRVVGLSARASALNRKADDDIVRDRMAVIGFSVTQRPVEIESARRYFSNPSDILSYYYYSDRGRYVTHAGKYIFKCVGERTWDNNSIPSDADFICGDAAVGYGYKIRDNRVDTPEFTWMDVHSVINEVEAEIPGLTAKIEEEEARTVIERRIYGTDINNRFKARGADRRIVSAWWGMAWRKEVSPEDFMDFVYKALANREDFAIAAFTWTGAELEELGWLVCKSVPRTKALLTALSKATDIKPATDKEYLAWKRRPKSWVFGE